MKIVKRRKRARMPKIQMPNTNGGPGESVPEYKIRQVCRTSGCDRESDKMARMLTREKNSGSRYRVTIVRYNGPFMRANDGAEWGIRLREIHAFAERTSRAKSMAHS